MSLAYPGVIQALVICTNTSSQLIAIILGEFDGSSSAVLASAASASTALKESCCNKRTATYSSTLSTEVSINLLDRDIELASTVSISDPSYDRDRLDDFDSFVKYDSNLVLSPPFSQDHNLGVGRVVPLHTGHNGWPNANEINCLKLLLQSGGFAFHTSNTR
jgi:hypothetical protein